MAVPGDPGGTLIFTRMLSQGNSCEFGHYDFGYSLVRSPRIRSRAVHNNKLAKKITRLNRSFRSIWHQILGAIGLFSMVGLGVLIAIMLFADIYIDTDLVTDQDLYSIIWLSVAMVIGNWLAIYGLTAVSDADVIPLVQFANGIAELDTIKTLQLDNSYLWEDMVYWLVGIGISDEIVNELVALGVDQDYISSDKSVSELTGCLSSISGVLSDVSTPSGAGGW